MNDTWRTWLMTGTRRPPIDARRVRGAHKGLKRMLVEGMSNGGDRSHSWTRFSGAMVRQAVDDGVRMLPPQQRELIKLAYFGGLSNAEIAQRMGINISSVERGLKQAVAAVSEYVERGRAAGRRAVYALVLFFCGRSLADSDHVVKAAQKHEIEVSVCGEMSGDPIYTVLLLGLGVRQLSVTPHNIPEIKKIIRSISMEEAVQVAQEALRLETARDVNNYLREQARRILPEVVS